MSSQAPQHEGEIQRYVIRLVEKRHRDSGEEWTELREESHPDGPWVRFEDHNAALFKAEADVVAAEARAGEAQHELVATLTEIAGELERRATRLDQEKATAHDGSSLGRQKFSRLNGRAHGLKEAARLLRDHLPEGDRE